MKSKIIRNVQCKEMLAGHQWSRAPCASNLSQLTSSAATPLTLKRIIIIIIIIRGPDRYRIFGADVNTSIRE